MGASTHVTVPLTIEGLTETVSIVEPEDWLDSTATGAGGLVTRTQIEELPLNGRNFLQLAALQPGVVVSRASGREFSGGFGTTQFAIAGARPGTHGYLLDGTNIADISDKAPSGMAGATAGGRCRRAVQRPDARLQRRVRPRRRRHHQRRDQVGHQLVQGVGLRVPSRQRARLSRLLRPGRAALVPKEPVRRVGGGPIARNRAFFFGSYEGLRSRNVVTRSARLPDANAHQGLLPDGQGGLKRVTVHPNVRPYLSLLFPLPDGTSFGDGTAELRHSHRDPVDEDFFVTKVDWHSGDSNRFSFRYSQDDSSAVLSQDHPLFLNFTGTGTNYLTGQHTKVITPRLLQELRVAFNRTTRDDEVSPTETIPPALYFTEDPHFGAINVIGLDTGRVDGHDPCQLRPAPVPGDRHRDVPAGRAYHQGRRGLAALRLPGLLLLALWRRVQVPKPRRVPHAAPQQQRPGRSLHGQYAGHRHPPAHEPALRRVFRAGRVAPAAVIDRECRYPLRVRHDAVRARRPGGGPAEPRRPRVGAGRSHAGDAPV